MRLPIRRLLRPGAITVSILFVVATAALASAQLTTTAPEICTAPASDISAGASFMAENEAAMNKMMSDMAIKPSGDADRDFVAMMVPHHQGAIDMALAVLRHGRNPQIRRLAQEIIVTQQQEIAVMRLAVGRSPASLAQSVRRESRSGPSIRSTEP